MSTSPPAMKLPQRTFSLLCNFWIETKFFMCVMNKAQVHWSQLFNAQCPGMPRRTLKILQQMLCAWQFLGTIHDKVKHSSNHFHKMIWYIGYALLCFNCRWGSTCYRRSKNLVSQIFRTPTFGKVNTGYTKAVADNSLRILEKISLNLKETWRSLFYMSRNL